jgi:hypothetical protein
MSTITAIITTLALAASIALGAHTSPASKASAGGPPQTATTDGNTPGFLGPPLTATTDDTP